MVNKSTNNRIEITREFKVSAQRVFDAWLDPKTIGEWLFATPDGIMEVVELEPWVGGKFYISEQRGDELAEHFGEYLEIDRPNKLVFSLKMDQSEPDTVVTIEIVDLEDGCRLTLSHDIDPKWAEYVDSAREGWQTILYNLKTLFDG